MPRPLERSGAFVFNQMFFPFQMNLIFFPDPSLRLKQMQKKLHLSNSDIEFEQFQIQIQIKDKNQIFKRWFEICDSIRNDISKYQTRISLPKISGHYFICISSKFSLPNLSQA